MSWFSVDLSRSEPNCAKAASSRILREVETQRAGHLAHRLDLRRAADAATELPTLIAGRTPWWNRSDSRKICPSVIEMTLVGM